MVVEFSAYAVSCNSVANGSSAYRAARLYDQTPGEIGVDPPVAPLVGVGQRRAPHQCAESRVVELGRAGRQAGLDVTQALANR